MTDLEYINHFFTTDPTGDETQAFEQRIANDPLFAQEVVFFLNTLEVARAEQREERKNQFKELYGKKTEINGTTPVKTIGIEKSSLRKMFYALAAAAVVTVVVLGYTLWMRPGSAIQLAKNYVRENFDVLPVTMGGGARDSLQTGLDLYNKGALQEAVQLFESLLKADSLNVSARKYAGIIYLRMQDYDKALVLFRQLAEMHSLYSNPGKFYQAITLMERNGPDDLATAKELLRQVGAQNLEGSEKAKEWLKKI